MTVPFILSYGFFVSFVVCIIHGIVRGVFFREKIKTYREEIVSACQRKGVPCKNEAEIGRFFILQQFVFFIMLLLAFLSMMCIKMTIGHQNIVVEGVDFLVLVSLIYAMVRTIQREIWCGKVLDTCPRIGPVEIVEAVLVTLSGIFFTFNIVRIFF